MLGVKPPDIQPKATDHINEMILMIEKLIKNKCAYLSDKNVLFDVSKYKYYGTLSRRSKTEQIAGSRIEVAKYKKIQKILFYGSQVKKTLSLVGNLLGVLEDLDGI